MKKIDLHIHTQSTISDAGNFDFSMDILEDYVKSENIDAVAITNHNIFDIDEFKLISKTLNITVFPGVEIDLENGHLLLICEEDSKDLLSEYCMKLKPLIINQDSTLTLNDFKEIFPIDFLKETLLIPHYKKKPIIKNEIIAEINKISRIYCGEVSTPKKFAQMKNNPNEELTPVLFSDFRASKNYNGNNDSYRVRQTYVNIGEKITIKSLKVALIANESNQVSVSQKDGVNLFDLKNGLTVSTGLNVIMGKRSSGKTYFLDEIYKYSENDRIKYIKQFELIERDQKKQEEKFNKNISQSSSRQKQEYLSEFALLVDKALDINDNKILKSLENYIDSLKEFASDSENRDVYSNSTLFKETAFTTKNLKSLKEIINAIVMLIENTEYKPIIDRFVSNEILEKMLLEIIQEYRKLNLRNIMLDHVNNIVDSVKSDLQFETTAPHIKEMNFEKIANNFLFKKKFNSLVNVMKREKQIKKVEVGNFTNVATREKFEMVSQIKNVIPGKYSLLDVFNQFYDRDPYEYLKSIDKNVKIDETEIYKSFINIEINILNSTGQPVSGGQMAEYNFLEKIDGALENDILLIDEPESSFDNMFLNVDINKKIKSIAKNIPVFISTHNSTVGMSIQPDYLIFAEKIDNAGDPEFDIYTGQPSSEYLINNKFKKYKTLDALLNCFEAGNRPYEYRREAYDLLKNFE